MKPTRPAIRPRRISLAWSNTIYVADTDKKAMREESQAASRALVNYSLLKMLTEMLLPPGYSDTASMKRIRAVKVTGKGHHHRRSGEVRRRHHPQP